MYYVLDREVVVEKEEFVVWRANGWILSPPPLSTAGHSTYTIIIMFS